MVQLIALNSPPQPDSYGVADSPIGIFLAAWENDYLVRLHLLPAHTEAQAEMFLHDFGWKYKMKQDTKRANQLVQRILFPNKTWNGSPKIKAGFYGTSFQHSIMKKMLAIPAGKTKSYQQLHKAARAVGSVCARNPLPFIVPCHRVTAAKEIGNYGFGPALKRQLLDWENS